MTSESDFLESIRENPDDDDLKLVYADWLDERGDIRGQLVRLSVEMRKIEQSGIDTEWLRMLRIQRERLDLEELCAEPDSPGVSVRLEHADGRIQEFEGTAIRRTLGQLQGGIVSHLELMIELPPQPRYEVATTFRGIRNRD